MARLTSSFFAAQLIRRVNGSGGFAALVKKGAEEAGAIHIAVLARDGAIRFYRPAPQTSYDQERAGQRKFQLDPVVTDQQALRTFTEKEERFDPDFWVVELELGNADELPFDVTTP